MADTRGWPKPAKRRKVQAMTLHREIMREAAVCSRMKPRFVIVDGKPVQPSKRARRALPAPPEDDK